MMSQSGQCCDYVSVLLFHCLSNINYAWGLLNYTMIDHLPLYIFHFLFKYFRRESLGSMSVVLCKRHALVCLRTSGSFVSSLHLSKIYT